MLIKLFDIFVEIIVLKSIFFIFIGFDVLVVVFLVEFKVFDK